MKKRIRLLSVLVSLWALLLSGSLTFADDAKRISKENLKSMLGSADLVVIDVRTGSDWSGSGFKIQGAVRENPRKVDKWAEKYAKVKTLVFYCA